MADRSAPFLTFVIFMQLGSAWDFTFKVSKDLIDATYPDSQVVFILEGVVNVIFLVITYTLYRRGSHAHKASRAQFWLAIALLFGLATNAVNEDFNFTVLATYYSGVFDTWQSVTTLLSVMLITSTFAGLYLYNASMDAGVGESKRLRDRVTNQKRFSSMSAFNKPAVSRGGFPDDSTRYGYMC